MGEMIEFNTSEQLTPSAHYDLTALTGELLADARNSITSSDVVTLPIAELSTLGAAVSSLVPAFHTVTQTMTIEADGLYRIANAAAGDTLKIAKNGNAWGALKTVAGKSKMAQLAQAGPLSATTQTVAAFDTATMMMAAALYSIEKDLSEIKETQQKILTFLEMENESQIEADVQSLTNIVTHYKYELDNERALDSNHSFCVEVKNRAQAKMNAFQKQVSAAVSSRKTIVTQGKSNVVLSDLEKKFKYYRLSLYTFALSSLLEIMLSGNFNEAYVCDIRSEIEQQSNAYRELFERASVYLEKLGNAGVEKKVVKGVGIASGAVGKLIGGIPLVKKGPVDEILQNKGDKLQSYAAAMETGSVRAFAALANPGTRILIEKMNDVVQIYNHTSQICFDRKNIYLMA